MGNVSQLTDRIGARYAGKSDSELAGLAQADDTRALVTMLERYEDFVRLKSRSYFLIGADRDDIVQEGMIGLYKAIRDYREDREASFKAFSEICITRQIITAIKTATRQKHTPLNSYVSLNNPISESDDPDRFFMEFLSDMVRFSLAACHCLSMDGEQRHAVRTEFCRDAAVQLAELFLSPDRGPSPDIPGALYHQARRQPSPICDDR